jgi:predicted DCC family thiol-disulfide oxidoreductase YuxK
MSGLPEHLLLFDGVCNLCNASVDFVIRRDTKRRFRFASLQSDVGQRILQEHGLSNTEFDSVLYLRSGVLHTKSGAALRISARLDGLWPMFAVFMVIPSFLRDAVYSWIARNRYAWFGMRETCRVPTAEERSLFLG